MELLDWHTRGALMSRRLDDGRVLDVVPLTYGRARLLLSRSAEVLCADDLW